MKKMMLLMLTAGMLMAEILWEPSFRAAQEEAKKENKPMLVILVSHTFRWCRRLENRTLQNPQIIDFVNENFVPVIVYREDGGYPREVIRSSAVPTTFFLTPEGKPFMKPAPGYWEPYDYISDLRMAVKKFKKLQAPR